MHELPKYQEPIRYRHDVLQELLGFGAMPRPGTQPRVAYRFLRALMTFEIRGLKAQRRELERFFGPQPLDDYARQIAELRSKYALLRRPLVDWIQTR